MHLNTLEALSEVFCHNANKGLKK
jgi:hypothetical protein